MWALIVDNRVAEVHATKPDTHADLNWIETELSVEPGALYENGTFVSLAEQQLRVQQAAEQAALTTVPAAISKFQAKMILNQYDLLNTVEAMMVDETTPITVKLAWNDAQEFRRNSPTIATMAAALNLDDATLDQMFIQAAQIQA